MRKYTYITGRILTLFFNAILVSQAHETALLQGQSSLGLSAYGSILEQQKSYLKEDTRAPKGITPEISHYDEVIERPFNNNVYAVPKVRNRCAFLLGRANFIHYRGKHPDHDCLGCPAADPAKVPENCMSVPGYLLVMMGGNGAACLPTLCCCICKEPSASSCPALLWERPDVCWSNLICFSLTGCSLMVSMAGGASYLYAESKGDQEFIDSYDRGRLCLPEDKCSCTGLTGYSVSELKVKLSQKCNDMGASWSVFLDRAGC